MEPRTHSHLELERPVPNFRLRSTDGGMVSAWDYRQKLNMAIFFFDPADDSHLNILRALWRRYHEFVDANAEVLAVADGPPVLLAERTADMPLPYPVLIDQDREARNLYGISESEALVTDRFGALRQRFRLHDFTETTLDEILTKIELMELECPECGAPTWEDYP